MSQCIFVTSGKGGVGKSTICTLLGACLGLMQKKVLLMELDAGLRGLDILNGVDEQTVFDLGDVLEKRCPPNSAILQSKLSDNLFLMPASNDVSFSMPEKRLALLVEGLKNYFDVIIMDGPCGMGENFFAGVHCADRSLIVTTPDLISAKDGRRVADLLREHGLTDCRLVINKVSGRFRPTQALPDLDSVIDITATQLIGVIPEDMVMAENLNSASAQLPTGTAKEAFVNLGKRVLGKYVPLTIQ